MLINSQEGEKQFLEAVQDTIAEKKEAIIYEVLRFKQISIVVRLFDILKEFIIIEIAAD